MDWFGLRLWPLVNFLERWVCNGLNLPCVEWGKMGLGELLDALTTIRRVGQQFNRPDSSEGRYLQNAIFVPKAELARRVLLAGRQGKLGTIYAGTGSLGGDVDCGCRLVVGCWMLDKAA